jgi:hypothetical protein
VVLSNSPSPYSNKWYIYLFVECMDFCQYAILFTLTGGICLCYSRVVFPLICFSGIFPNFQVLFSSQEKCKVIPIGIIPSEIFCSFLFIGKFPTTSSLIILRIYTVMFPTASCLSLFMHLCSGVFSLQA